MTIASAFNEIAVAQGGTASSSGTIAGAIDALTDALAGSDVQSPSTIEGAVRLLGQHIGGGGGSTTTTVYISELIDDEPPTYQAPTGTVSVDGTVCQASGTVTIDAGVTITAGAYEVPLGEPITYAAPSGYGMASCEASVYPSIDEMLADGDVISSMTITTGDSSCSFLASASGTPTFATCAVTQD